jgi:hypothetical protein
MTKDILAFVCRPGSTMDVRLELPRAARLFGVLAGLDGAADPLYALRGRFPGLAETSHSEFDLTMAQYESYLTRAELVRVLAAHEAREEQQAHEAREEQQAHALLAQCVKETPAFTLAFGFY